MSQYMPETVVVARCESCGTLHRPMPHCPNCGQADGFHATWDFTGCMGGPGAKDTDTGFQYPSL
jgi:hypothetical protein